MRPTPSKSALRSAATALIYGYRCNQEQWLYLFSLLRLALSAPLLTQHWWARLGLALFCLSSIAITGYLYLQEKPLLTDNDWRTRPAQDSPEHQHIKTQMQHERWFLTSTAMIQDTNLLWSLMLILLIQSELSSHLLALQALLAAQGIMTFLHVHVLQPQTLTQEVQTLSMISRLRLEELKTHRLSESRSIRNHWALIVLSTLVLQALLQIISLESLGFLLLQNSLQQALLLTTATGFLIMHAFARTRLISAALLYGASTAIALIVLTQRYLDWFADLGPYLLCQLQGIPVFATCCLFIGIVCGFFYYRRSEREMNLEKAISQISSAELIKQTTGATHEPGETQKDRPDIQPDASENVPFT